MKNNSAIKKVGIFLIIIGVILAIVGCGILIDVHGGSLDRIQRIRQQQMESRAIRATPGYFTLGFGLVMLIAGFICTAMSRSCQIPKQPQGEQQFPAAPQMSHPQAQCLCPNCHKPVPYGTRFCGSCGTELQWGPQPVNKNSHPV